MRRPPPSLTVPSVAPSVAALSAIALLTLSAPVAGQPRLDQSSPERQAVPPRTAEQTIEPATPEQTPERQPTDQRLHPPVDSAAGPDRQPPDAETAPPGTLPESAPGTLASPEQEATEELRRSEAASDVDRLTDPANTVTMQDPVSPEEAARAEGMTGTRQPPQGDPVPLPDTPEAVVEELNDKGVTGVEVPPGVGEPPQAGNAQPAAPSDQARQNQPRQAAILGRTVRDLDGQVVGRIDDLLIDQRGALTHALVESGGRMVAIPWSQLRSDKDGPDAYVPMRRSALLSDPAYAYRGEAETAVRPPATDR